MPAPALVFLFRQRDHLQGSPESFKSLCSSTLRLTRFSQRLHFAADLTKASNIAGRHSLRVAAGFLRSDNSVRG
jgi:hypothetical protein